MKKRKIWLISLLVLLLLAACSPVVPTPEAVEEQPQPTEVVSETESIVEKVDEAEILCKYDACIRGAVVINDGEYLMVFFDLVGTDGKVNEGDVKYITGTIQTAGYLLDEDGSEEVVFDREYTNQEYFCYAGEDLPWSEGALASTCGFGIPLSELDIVPTDGDRMRVELPLFLGYEQELTVLEMGL